MKKRIALALAGLVMGIGSTLLAVQLAGPRPARAVTAPVEPKAMPSRAERLRGEVLPSRYEDLKELYVEKAPPREGDWLAGQDEAGQSLREYVRADPVRATPERSTLYVVAIGDFSPQQHNVLLQTTDYLGAYYQLPVKTLAPVPAKAVKAEAQRRHPATGALQWNSGWLLDSLLVGLRPDDAVALVGFTVTDLYPDPDWNFVFGQASLTQRVGVWSIARNGDLEAEPKLFLLRTLKTAVHEVGHMFSIPHCIAYECVMNGSNNQAESDRTPLEPCPVCLAKLAHATHLDPAKRFAALEALLVGFGLQEDALKLQAAREVLPEAEP